MLTSEKEIARVQTQQGEKVRPKNEPDSKVRLNLEVPKKLRSQLDDLVERSGATNLTEVVRRSLALYDLVLEHTHEGGDLLFRHADGTSEVLRIL